MDVLAVINHLLNFIAPALFVALLLALAGRAALADGSWRGWWRAFWRTFWVSALAAIAVLTGGLFLFGNDGKMLTYAVLVLVCGSVQWVLGRGWRA